MQFEAHKRFVKLAQVSLVPDIATDCIGVLFNLDAERIKQVLTNALLNSIRATEYGSITISVRAEKSLSGDCKLLFSVIDTGNGFGNLDPRRLLNPLYLPEDAGAWMDC